MAPPSLFSLVLIGLSLISARLAMNRAIAPSKIAVMFFRIIILFIILCIFMSIILEQTTDFQPSHSSDFHLLDQPQSPISSSSSSSHRHLAVNDADIAKSKIIYDAPSFSPNEQIPLYSSRLFTMEDPTKALYYDSVQWPCSEPVANFDTDYDTLPLLSAYQQIPIRASPYKLAFANTTRQSLCGRHTLTAQHSNTFMRLIDDGFIYELWLDNLPIYAPIGFKQAHPANDGQTAYYLYTHRHFDMVHNEEFKIITASIRDIDHDHGTDLDTDSFIVLNDMNGEPLKKIIEFTYSVTWSKGSGTETMHRNHEWRAHLIHHAFIANKAYQNAITLYMKHTPIEYHTDLSQWSQSKLAEQAENENMDKTDGDGEGGAEDQQGEGEEEVQNPVDVGSLQHPAEIQNWPKPNISTVSEQELTQNEAEWKLDADDGVQFKYDELSKCGNANDFYVQSSKERLRYYDKVRLWPIPQKFVLYEEQHVMIKRDIQWSCTCGDLLQQNEILKDAVRRYDELIFEHRIDTETEAKYQSGDAVQQWYGAVHVVIDDVELTETVPSENMDEWYEIVLPFAADAKSGCHTIYIHSHSVFGTLRAIETLSQLIYYDFDLDVYKVRYVGYIRDYPYFKYRGVLLDTSRHFHPVGIVKHVIDSISYAKFNVLHWHMVDDQSWPFPISGKYDKFDLSDLYNKAAFSKQERYSVRDIQDIIHYANIRGIRVIPEFDVPGHVGAWCKAFDICIDVACHHSTNGVLDPSKPLTFEIVKAVYDQIVTVFNDTYLHIGNDEANYQCYENNSNLHAWYESNKSEMQFSGIRKRKHRDGLTINAYTVSELFKLFEEYKVRNKKVLISWDDLYGKVNNVIPQDTILMVWTSRWQKFVPKMLKSGYKLIIAAPFYVDRWYEPLTDRYFADLWPKTAANMQQRHNIIGGEACLWSERVDASVLDAKLWPDAAATAENLWMGPTKIKTLIPLWSSVIRPRLKWYRCFMMRRDIGFMAIDVNKKYPTEEFYLREPYWPFSCMEEKDIRPIEQILPDNTTKEARRAARVKAAAAANANNDAAAAAAKSELNKELPAVIPVPQQNEEKSESEDQSKDDAVGGNVVEKTTQKAMPMKLVLLAVLVGLCVVGVICGYMMTEKKDKHT